MCHIGADVLFEPVSDLDVFPAAIHDCIDTFIRSQILINVPFAKGMIVSSLRVQELIKIVVVLLQYMASLYIHSALDLHLHLQAI